MDRGGGSTALCRCGSRRHKIKEGIASVRPVACACGYRRRLGVDFTAAAAPVRKLLARNCSCLCGGFSRCGAFWCIGRLRL
eukprot:352428-Chlamydomonas_euryale.AAC.5